MNIKERLEKKKIEMEEIVRKINQLDKDRQELLQEAFRLDGEYRLLVSLNKEEEIKCTDIEN